VYFQSADQPKRAVLRKSKVRVSPNDRGFMFADGVYEVIRSYQGRLFLVPEHLARLRRSLRSARIQYAGVREIPAEARELLRRNNLLDCDATVYLHITRGVYPRRHAFPPRSVLPTFYMEANRFEPYRNELTRGVRVITVPDFRWSRCDIKSLALLGNVLARQEAVDKGAFEAIFVRDGLVTEGTHTNVFGVRNGRLVTHPRCGSILGGITRELTIRLCRRLRIPLDESGIRQDGLRSMDELFLAGTTVEVMPIVRVDGRRVGTGKPGPTTLRLQRAFLAESRPRPKSRHRISTLRRKGTKNEHGQAAKSAPNW
jgi:D-alanine transaminase